MSDPMLPPHNSDDQWEAAVQRMAVDMVYPPTPNIAGKVRQRLERRPAPMLRFAQAALIVVLLLGGLLAVPQVRAEVIRILQIGVIRIIFDEPESPTGTPRATAIPDSGVLNSVLDLPGETSLAAARDALDFDILLPTYPADLGDPDRVFLIRSHTTAVALVWTDPADPDSPILSLFAFPPDSNVWKNGMGAADEIRIDGEFALWTTDPHLIEFESDGRTIYRRVADSVLIWFADGITYRLEGALTLDEAILIVESLSHDEP